MTKPLALLFLFSFLLLPFQPALAVDRDAPVWAPAAVTAVGAVGGAIASWYYGNALGYYSEGANQQGDAAIGNEMLSLEATAMAVSGMMSVERMGGASQQVKGLSKKEVNSVLKQADKNAQSAYQRALVGGRHEPMIEQYANKPIKDIQSGINSYQSRIQKHLNNLQNPELKPGWNAKPLQEQTGAIKHWITEIKVWSEQKQILQTILKQKGGGGR